MTTLDLRDLTPEARNARVNEAVAVHCAGWKKQKSTPDVPVSKGGMTLPNHFSLDPIDAWTNDTNPAHTGVYCMPPRFAESADAVLPLLEKQFGFRCEMVIAGFTVTVSRRGEPTDDNPLAHYREHGTAETFPLAACIALLRAAGIEVTT